MPYIYKLNMDNKKGESCDVVVKFTADSFSRFTGFISIDTNTPLYSEDLAHLEEWVVMGKDQWVAEIQSDNH